MYRWYAILETFQFLILPDFFRFCLEAEPPGNTRPGEGNGSASEYFIITISKMKEF